LKVYNTETDTDTFLPIVLNIVTYNQFVNHISTHYTKCHRNRQRSIGFLMTMTS